MIVHLAARCRRVPVTSNVRRHMQSLRSFIVRPQIPLWQYCILAVPVALIPSGLLAWAARFVFASAGVDLSLVSPPDRQFSASELFGTAVFAPIVETSFLALGLRGLSTPSANLPFIALASATAWGCLHALFGFLWLFGTVWSFFVFSVAYLAWRPQSFTAAFVAAALPHAAMNLLSVLLLLVVDNAA